MRKPILLRSVLFSLAALVIFGLLGVSSHAGKPKPALITVAGAIQGSGTDAAAMAVTFLGLNEAVNRLDPYVANPNGNLAANGTGRTGWSLSYYYCDHELHAGSVEPCSNTAHDPWNYRRLIIKEGALAGKGQPVLVAFPQGNSWEIWRKARPGEDPRGVMIESGELTQPVTYQETAPR